MKLHLDQKRKFILIKNHCVIQIVPEILLLVKYAVNNTSPHVR